eukprot:1158749-Pelagomonas_calceolata.AAC.7
MLVYEAQKMNCTYNQKQCSRLSAPKSIAIRRKRSSPVARHASAGDLPNVPGQNRTRVVAVGEALFEEEAMVQVACGNDGYWVPALRRCQH